MKGHYVMSLKEGNRLTAMERVKRKNLNFREASLELGISYRHVFRIYKRYIADGASGLLHKGRGKTSNRKISSALRKKVLALYRKRFSDFGPTLFGEKLEELGMKISRETLRLWLIGAGLWEKKRRGNAHRQRRERRKRFGELVQMDGSHHKWFENRGEKSCLMQMVDDATGKTLALLAPEETTQAAMELLRKWISSFGIPKSLYTDRKKVFIATREATLDEQLAGKEPKTQFGLACEKLGIEIIPANSPQAKGRVERKHGVLQDRLVKELRLEGISAIEKANELLDSGFMKKLNEKFCVQPASTDNAHSPLPETINLDDVFCIEEERKIANDWTVRYKGKLLQVINQPLLPKAKTTITVRETFKGELSMVFRGRNLKFKEIDERPKTAKKAVSPKTTGGKSIPSHDHPWRNAWNNRRETVKLVGHF